MNAENNNGFTIIHGRDFGLPCNLKCGPEVKPCGTIYFENRRNQADEYDSSNELGITLKRKPKLLATRIDCFFTNQEIEELYHFVWLHLDIIKTYVNGFTTSKGFLRDLHRAKENPVRDEVISWKRLVFVQYGIVLYVRYWPKEFVIEYKSKFGVLRYHSSHIPVSIPKIYTEESIIENCMKMWPDFLKAENYIAEHKELLDYETANLQNKLVFYKNQPQTDFSKASAYK